MELTAFIYDLKNRKGKEKTYLIRKVFGYKENKFQGKYIYYRKGLLTKYILEKWGKSIILTKSIDSSKVKEILNKNKIIYKIRRLRLLD